MNEPAQSGIALIGTGALALEILEYFGRQTFSCCFSDPEFAANSRLELPLHTDIDTLQRHAHFFVLGMAVPQDRLDLCARLAAAGMEPAPPLIGSGTVISPSATVAAGSVIGHGVHVGSRSQIGPHNLVMHNTILGHDLTTDEHVIISPTVFVAGYVRIGKCTVINAHASLARDLVVGAQAFIAQGAACFRNVPDGGRAIGNPAKIFPGNAQLHSMPVD